MVLRIIYLLHVVQSGEFVSEDVIKQADQCLKNLGAVLTKAGGTFENSNSNNVSLSELWILSTFSSSSQGNSVVV